MPLAFFKKRHIFSQYSWVYTAALLLPLALIVVFPDVFANSDLTSDGYRVDVGRLSPIKTTNAGGGESAFLFILKNLADILLVTIPVLAAIAVIIAGYLYIFSGGDHDRVSKAKTIIKWNLIALLVALLSFTLVNIIASFFNS